MGALKTAFYAWKRKYYPEIRLDGPQIEFIQAYFENVESGEDGLPDVKGKSVCQMLIAGFWEDQKEKL